MRGTKEYTHFLRVALGSAAELEEILKLLKTYINKMTNQSNQAREDEVPCTPNP